MKMDSKVGTILISVFSVIIIALVVLVFMNKVSIDLAMLIIGGVLVLSGLVQLKMSKDANSKVIKRETYGASKFSIIIGALMLLLMGLKMILV